MPSSQDHAVCADPAPRLPSARYLQRSLIWLLIVAAALPAVILAAGGWFSWQLSWRESRFEVTHTAEAAAEYASRLLLGYNLAASRIDDLLQGLTDAEIREREAELHAALKELLVDLPLIGAAYVVDRDGVPLVSAYHLPVPQSLSVADRDYFGALQAENPPTVHVSQVYSSRIDGRAFFAVSRRRTNRGGPQAPDAFDGLVNISVDPSLIAEGLRRLVATPADTIALVRADGAMLAWSSGAGSGQAPPADGHFHPGRFDAGPHRPSSGLGMSAGSGDIVAVHGLNDLPIYTIATRPRAAVVARWWRAYLPQLAIGLPAMVALVGLALMVRRSQLGLYTAYDKLEARVSERTAAMAEISEALDLTPSMITDLTGRITYWSEGCVRLYGYPRSEALGHNVSMLLATEFPAGGRAGLLAILLRHGEWKGELRQRRRDGTPIVTGSQWTLRLDRKTGQPVSVVSTRTDLSALRQAERALSRSEAGLRRAQEASGIVAFEIAEDGTVVADAALPRVFGLPETTPLSVEHFLAQLHPADRAAATALQRELARDGGSFSDEFRVLLADGSERWLLARGEATADPSGAPVPRQVAGIILDVTNRRAAETALAESDERLRLAQAAAGFGIYDYDFRTGSVTWDARMRALWALPDDVPVTNRLFLAGLHPDDRERRLDAVRKAMDFSGSDGVTAAYQVEYRVIGLMDGQERWIATTGQVRFSGGVPVRLTGLAMDITARKRADQRNELLMREVDHRAKNALAVVQAALRLSRAETPAELVRIVEGRVAALARAQTILASRRWEGAELDALLQGELAPFLTGIREGAPRAELTGPPVMVAAHAAQPLCMAIHELATNAMKYGALSHAGGLLQVSWRLDTGARMLALTWRESGGPGITTTMPGRRGFGSRVIEQTVQGQLGGTVSRRWLPGGLICELAIPLSWSEPGKSLVLDGEPAVAA